MERQSAIYEREILISINPEEIGVFKVKMFGERINNKIVVLVIPKSETNLAQSAGIIISNINSEIFNRIKVDLIKNVDIILIDSDKFSKIVFDSNELSEFHLDNIEPNEIQSLEY